MLLKLFVFISAICWRFGKATPVLHIYFFLYSLTFSFRPCNLHPLTFTSFPGILSIFSNPELIVIAALCPSLEKNVPLCFKSVHLDIISISLQLVPGKSGTVCPLATGLS